MPKIPLFFQIFETKDIWDGPLPATPDGRDQIEMALWGYTARPKSSYSVGACLFEHEVKIGYVPKEVSGVAYNDVKLIDLHPNVRNWPIPTTQRIGAALIYDYLRQWSTDDTFRPREQQISITNRMQGIVIERIAEDKPDLAIKGVLRKPEYWQ